MTVALRVDQVSWGKLRDTFRSNAGALSTMALIALVDDVFDSGVSDEIANSVTERLLAAVDATVEQPVRGGMPDWGRDA